MAGRQSWVWKGVWSTSSTGLHWWFYWAASHHIPIHPNEPPWPKSSSIFRKSEAHGQSCFTQFICGISSSQLPHTACCKPRSGPSVSRETSQVPDKLEPNIYSAKSPGNQRERQAWRTAWGWFTFQASLLCIFPPNSVADQKWCQGYGDDQIFPLHMRVQICTQLWHSRTWPWPLLASS